MGLKAFLSRWSKSEDARALERAEEETRMTPHERDVDQEDFLTQKEDIAMTNRWAAGATIESGEGELSDD